MPARAELGNITPMADGSLTITWELSSSSDRRALDVVDGSGPFESYGPHYSRRTPGSKTFTGVGREIVLVTSCGRAVWACVYQATPMVRGSGASRGRQGETDRKARYLWRNMMFRNLGAGLSSDLVKALVVAISRPAGLETASSVASSTSGRPSAHRIETVVSRLPEKGLTARSWGYVWRVSGRGLSTSCGVHTQRLLAKAYEAGFKAGRRKRSQSNG